MAENSNVIDMTARRKEQISNEDELRPAFETNQAVFDMTERRQEVIKEERRLVKRTILTEFIGAYAVIPEQGLAKVAIYDISEQGMGIDLETEYGNFAEGEEVAMRIYLSNDTFLPFVAKVYNVRKVPEEGVYRHGVAFMKESTDNDALMHFVSFLESVSTSLRTDNGDVVVTKVRR